MYKLLNGSVDRWLQNSTFWYIPGILGNIFKDVLVSSFHLLPIVALSRWDCGKATPSINQKKAALLPTRNKLLRKV